MIRDYWHSHTYTNKCHPIRASSSITYLTARPVPNQDRVFGATTLRLCPQAPRMQASATATKTAPLIRRQKECTFRRFEMESQMNFHDRLTRFFGKTLSIAQLASYVLGVQSTEPNPSKTLGHNYFRGTLFIRCLWPPSHRVGPGLKNTTKYDTTACATLKCSRSSKIPTSSRYG